MPNNFLGNILRYTKVRLLDGNGSLTFSPNTVEYLYFCLYTKLETGTRSV